MATPNFAEDDKLVASSTCKLGAASPSTPINIPAPPLTDVFNPVDWQSWLKQHASHHPSPLAYDFLKSCKKIFRQLEKMVPNYTNPFEQLNLLSTTAVAMPPLPFSNPILPTPTPILSPPRYNTPTTVLGDSWKFQCAGMILIHRPDLGPNIYEDVSLVSRKRAVILHPGDSTNNFLE